MRPQRGRGLPGLLAALLLAACAAPTPSPSACPTAAPTADEATTILAGASSVEVKTNKGSFTIDLQPDSAPIATASFVALARCGFYAGISFHRVIAGFVIQAGDPQTRDNHGDFESLGSGGPGYHFEVEQAPSGTSYTKYMVAMANAMQYDQAGNIQGGTDTNGSQFFVMLDDAPQLPPYYSVLGTVSAGQGTVDAIGQLPTSGDPTNVPLDPAIIESMTVQGTAQPS
ncbi:MAG TPA: peptidylprolyl isomerase [Candidatus Limnocylindria bacterium]